MKTTFAIGFTKDTGTLVVQKTRGDLVRSMPCPFSSKNTPCGAWCVHCGTIMFEENFFVLDLTCGTGARLVAIQEVK